MYGSSMIFFVSSNNKKTSSGKSIRQHTRICGVFVSCGNRANFRFSIFRVRDLRAEKTNAKN